MKDLDYRKKAEILKLLSHPTRLMIMHELSKGAKCVADIQDLLDIRQSNVSQHLSALRRIDVVDFYEDGAQRCYYLTRPKLVRELFRFISGSYPVVIRSREDVHKEGLRRMKGGEGGRNLIRSKKGKLCKISTCP
ncbi:MAG: winged helix-turn-helix transcriptional regulator [Deferribacteres bacterium]|nr:winged helix-turn-helix transcriptional regulator [Deferribacteres bacterium]